MAVRLHTSSALKELIDSHDSDYFTLDWLVDQMPNHSFGIVIIFLAVLSVVPVIDFPARFLLIFIALRVMLGYPVALPKRVMRRRLSVRYLSGMEKHAVPALQRLERFVRPRWEPFLGARRLSGVLLLLLNVVSLLAPIPFVNVPPAMAVFLMALAYIEHDGLLLAVAQVASITMLGAVAAFTLAAKGLF